MSASHPRVERSALARLRTFGRVTHHAVRETSAMTDLKRDDDEHPVPDHLRGLFAQVAQAFSEGDFQLLNHHISNVAPIDHATAESVKKT